MIDVRGRILFQGEGLAEAATLETSDFRVELALVSPFQREQWCRRRRDNMVEYHIREFPDEVVTRPVNGGTEEERVVALPYSGAGEWERRLGSFLFVYHDPSGMGDPFLSFLPLLVSLAMRRRLRQSLLGHERENNTDSQEVTWSPALLRPLLVAPTSVEDGEVEMLVHGVPQGAAWGPRTGRSLAVSWRLQLLSLVECQGGALDAVLAHKLCYRLLHQHLHPSERCRAYGTEALQSYRADPDDALTESPTVATQYYLQAALLAQNGLLVPVDCEVQSPDWVRGRTSHADSLVRLYSHLASLHHPREAVETVWPTILRPFHYEGEDYVNHCLLYLTHGGSVGEELEQKVLQCAALRPALAALEWRSSSPSFPPPTLLQYTLYTLRRQLITALSNAAQSTLVCLANGVPVEKDKIEKRAVAVGRAASLSLQLLRLHGPPSVSYTPASQKELVWVYQQFLKSKWREVQLWNALEDTNRRHHAVKEVEEHFRVWENRRRRDGVRPFTSPGEPTTMGASSAEGLVGWVPEEAWSSLKGELTLLGKYKNGTI